MSIKPRKEVAKAWLTIYRNLPWEATILYTAPSGAKINLTGASIKAVVKADVEDEDALHTFSTALGTITAGNGFMTFSIPLVETIDAFDWEEAVMHIVIQIGSEVPKAVELIGLVIRSSTTGTP